MLSRLKLAQRRVQDHFLHSKLAFCGVTKNWIFYHIIGCPQKFYDFSSWLWLMWLFFTGSKVLIIELLERVLRMFQKVILFQKPYNQISFECFINTNFSNEILPTTFEVPSLIRIYWNYLNLHPSKVIKTFFWNKKVAIIDQFGFCKTFGCEGLFYRSLTWDGQPQTGKK